MGPEPGVESLPSRSKVVVCKRIEIGGRMGSKKRPRVHEIRDRERNDHRRHAASERDRLLADLKGPRRVFRETKDEAEAHDEPHSLRPQQRSENRESAAADEPPCGCWSG